MPYDFSKLNDREFESLGASIIEKIIGKRVEQFKAGRDGGVDGRFWIGDTKEGIIQCKHYIETPYKTLIAKLKSEEATKVKKLDPGRYFFMTSKKLTRKNKQEIKKIFDPFIKMENDIFGQEDLNDFLIKKENQNIVEQNFKLWITSSSVLDIIFNNAIKGRSENTIRNIQEESYKYAVTANHKKGLSILKDKNVIILTGEPGIGKTTLADNLALYYITKGYEFCDIEENISEAENIFREKEKKKILFYCDDFLGSNFYDAISNKKDSHFVKFINRVSKDNSKKFILTSRTNILNKAYSLSHKFQNEKIRDNEYLLKVENLTDLDKAQILYNHIYHSKLKKEYIDKIYENKKYKEIIFHRSFNPRIIEFVTDNNRVGNVSPKKYWEYIINNLNYPEDIWADYFQNQADDPVRALTYLTVFNNGKIPETKLQDSYNTFIKIHPINLGDHSDKNFNAIRKLAVQSLLNRNHVEDDKFEYTLFNPSITDFILGSYSQDSELISNILISLKNQTSIRYVKALAIHNKISDHCLKNIQLNLFDYFFEKKIKEKDWGFLLSITNLNIFDENLNDRMQQFLNALVNSDDANGENLSELIFILSYIEPSIEIKNYKFLHSFIDNIEDVELLMELLEFIEQFNLDDPYILSKSKEHLENYLEEMANYHYLDINFSDYVDHNYYPEDGSTDYNIDYTGIESEIIECFDSLLADFNQSALKKIDLDKSNILSRIDVENMAIEYMESYDHNYGDEEGSYYSDYSTQDDIDALFERS